MAPSFSRMASATVPRLYHSSALLLPDATVLIATYNRARLLDETLTWLARMRVDFTDETVAAVYGRQEPLPDSDAFDKRDLWMRGFTWYRERIGDVAKAAVGGPINKIGTGLGPWFQIPFELVTQSKLFPEVMDPRFIRDPWRNLFATVTLENEYDYFMGKPSRGYLRSWQEGVVTKRDAGEMAYNEARGWTYEWLAKKKGGDVIPAEEKAKGKYKNHKVTAAQVQEIAKTKMADLNANDLDAAEKIIAGTARSMGITVV